MTPSLYNFGTALPHVGRPGFSPLVLADRLISLAQDADRAGLTDSAARIIGLVYQVLDDDGAALA